MVISVRMVTKEFDLDNIIKEIGEFGKFQFINYILISIAIAFAAIYTLTYIFTAGDLSYRCKIPECDGFNIENDWIKYAIPFDDNNNPSRCERHPNVSNNISLEICEKYNFDQSQIVNCDQLIFANDEKTILNEVSVLYIIYE